jgi:hypothetical protein
MQTWNWEEIYILKNRISFQKLDIERLIRTAEEEVGHENVHRPAVNAEDIGSSVTPYLYDSDDEDVL